MKRCEGTCRIIIIMYEWPQNQNLLGSHCDDQPMLRGECPGHGGRDREGVMWGLMPQCHVGDDFSCVFYHRMPVIYHTCFHKRRCF